MRRFIKKHPKLCIFFLVVLLAAVLGYTCSSANLCGGSTALEEDEEKEVLQAGMGDQKIREDAILQWEYDYSLCEHVEFVSTTVPEEYVGLTQAQLLEKLKDVEVLEMSPSLIKLRKTYDCYCQKHYILKNTTDGLCIYQTTAGTDEQQVVMTLSNIVISLTAEDEEALKIGKVFTSINDVMTFVNRYQSDVLETTPSATPSPKPTLSPKSSQPAASTHPNSTATPIPDKTTT